MWKKIQDTYRRLFSNGVEPFIFTVALSVELKTVRRDVFGVDFQALNLHNHGHSEEDVHNAPHDHEESNHTLWKCVVCGTAVYALFIWETVLSAVIKHVNDKAGKKHEQHRLDEVSHGHGHISDLRTIAYARDSSAPSRDPEQNGKKIANCEDTHLPLTNRLLGKTWM